WEDRIDADLVLGRHAELVGELETLVGEHPYRERLWGQLMLALYRDQRQADALHAYARVRSLLADELGIEPSKDLQRLETAILRQDPGLDRVPTVAATGDARRASNGSRTPFPPSLVVAEPFIGRAALLEWLDLLLGRAAGGDGRCVALCGPDGSGRTRLVAEFARRAY